MQQNKQKIILKGNFRHIGFNNTRLKHIVCILLWSIQLDFLVLIFPINIKFLFRGI